MTRDAQIDRKCPDRRDFLARLPVADGDAMPDLLHDLEVHGAAVRLRYCEHSVHINIHSVHNLVGAVQAPRAERDGASAAYRAIARARDRQSTRRSDGCVADARSARA